MKKNNFFEESEWDDWIDSEEVHLKMNICKRTLQRWRLNGLIPYSRLGGRCYYKKSDIIAVLKKHYNGGSV